MITLELLSRLEGVRSRGTGKWSARCPAHQDNSPSLSIREGTDRILLHCFALCEKLDIVKALGLTMADLFFDALTHDGYRTTSKLVKIDLVALAFRIELGALDRRLRAERVLKAATNFNIDELSEQQFDRFMSAVARAYSDGERAEFLETVADDVRLKAFLERTGQYAT